MSNSVAALAFLKVNWEREGKDYLDNFVPLVAEAIRAAGLTVVTLEAAQEALSARFGMTLPLHPLKAVLERARKREFLRRDNRVLYANPEALQDSLFDETEVEVRGVHDRVVHALQAYAADDYNQQWDEEFAERALLDALEADGTKFLFASYEGRAFTAGPESDSTRFIVGSFVRDAQEIHAELLKDLETLAKGHLLAAALFLPRPGEHGRRFRNTTVFFDTRLLIYAAGYAGPGLEGPARELCELLSRYGAELRYLEDTMHEVLGVLNGTLHLMRQGRSREAYGDVMAFLVEAGLDAGDLELMIARLPEKLRFLQIDVAEAPTYREQKFVVDEPGFEAALQSQIGYKNRSALVHDLDAISAIARMRRGHESFAVETCSAVFVTTNSALARVTRRFFQPDATYGSVPLCLTDQALASVLWVKGPTNAPDLPRKLLISNAYAATQPTEDFWKLYLAEIARLEEKGDITETDYALLRYSTAAKRAVMDVTQGDPAAFTEGTVQEVLRRAEAAVREDLEQELRAKDLRIGEQESVLESTRSDLAALVRRDQLVADIRAERITIAARSLARNLMRIPRWTLMALLALGVILTFPFGLPAITSAPLSYLAPGVLALLLVSQLVDLGFDLSPREVLARTEERVAEWLVDRGQWLLASVETVESDQLKGASEQPLLPGGPPPEDLHDGVGGEAETVTDPDE